MPETTFIWKYESEGSQMAAHLKNVHLSTWVPQNALLADPRLTAFITHGGLGSATELAHLGKPAILVPIFADQTRNAHMLAKHGGGIVLNKVNLEHPQVLRESLRKIFDDASFSQNAKRLSEMLINQPISAKQLLIRHSEFAAKFGRLPNLDPYGRHLSMIEYYLIDIVLVAVSAFLVIGFVAVVIVRRCFTIKTKKMNLSLAVLFMIISCAETYKFLVYSPTFGYSHINFMEAIADTLSEAGHDVTVLRPLMDDELENKSKLTLTKKVIKTPTDPRVKEVMKHRASLLNTIWTTQSNLLAMWQ
ncbi:hypothetical protein TELCIR_15727, partial [Teladorsagia circumcincta]